MSNHTLRYCYNGDVSFLRENVLVKILVYVSQSHSKIKRATLFETQRFVEVDDDDDDYYYY